MIVEDCLKKCRRLIETLTQLRERSAKLMYWNLVCEANEVLAELYEIQKDCDSRVARLRERQGR